MSSFQHQHPLKTLLRVWPIFAYILQVILKCTAEKEGAKEGVIYNRTVRD